ncbi:MAG: FG-GAP-like repeat-containing protein [Polyangiales bacterium]
MRPSHRPLALAATLLAAVGCGAPAPTPDAATDIPARDVAPVDATVTPDVSADVAPDVAPMDALPPVDAPPPDVGVPPPECTPFSITPAMVRIATGRGAYFRTMGGSNRGALFTLSPGAMTGGATLTPGGGLLAGPRAATFEVIANDMMCSATARARVEVVGPFVLEPTEVRVAPSRTLRFMVSGALGAVRWEVLQRPVDGARMGDGSLDAMGVFSSGTVPGIYRLRAADMGSGDEVQATVTVATGTTFAPSASMVLVPRGRRVRLDWRGGSRYVNASITGGTAGGVIAGTAGEVLFDATSARVGSATVSATDRYTNERTTVRVVVGEELAPPPVPRGPVTYSGDVAVGDVNNDGRPDMVLGQGNRSENGNETGGVLVYHGQADGRLRATPDAILNGVRDNDLFGANLSVVDADGDRIDDVVVASPNQDLGRDGRGSVQFFLGSTAGLVTTPERTFVGENNGDAFGTSIALEDLDADGARDLVVTAPNGANAFNAACGRAGRVYVYRGMAGVRGLFQTLPWQVLDVRDRLDDLDGAPQCRASSSVGSGLAILDMDNDGLRDLVLGAPGAGAPNFGSVIIYRGTARGIFEETPSWTVHLDAAMRTNNPRFGFGLDVVPVSATNKVLVVRVPTFGQNPAGVSTANAGGFFVLRPGSLGARPVTGMMRVLTTSIATARFAGSNANDNVGRSGAVGDFDGDGDLDYVVGGANLGFDGVLNAFEASALMGSGTLTAAVTLRGEMSGTEALGQRVSIGRAPTGMAPAVAVISSFRSTPTAVFGGAVRWIPQGAPRAFSDRWSAATWFDVPVLPAADRTGTSVALGALRGSTAGDFVTGSPGAHSPIAPMVGTTPARPAGFRGRTGAVDVIGASLPAAQRFWVDRTNAQLGASVAVLDFDGDGRADVAVGDPAETTGGTDMITRVTPNLANTATDPCWYRTGATGTTVATASVGGRGIVRIYLQGADGTFREGFQAIARESVATGAAIRRKGFGFSVANAGDVNGDGINDLLVGRSTASDGNGAEVVLGRRADTAGRITVVCADPATSPYWASRGDNIVFGVAVAGLGDLDDDGCADTAVSISGSGKAGVSVQYGFGTACRRGHASPHEILVVPDDRPLMNNDPPGGTPRPAAMRTLDWTDLPGAATGMGLVIAGGGDLNGDRVPDLVMRDASLAWQDRVGPAVEIISGAYLNGLCPDHACAEGLAERFYSDGAGYNVVGVRTLPSPDRMVVPVDTPTSVRFGAALAVADVDGDGAADLVVGAPDDATQGDFAGAVLAWRASSDPDTFAAPPWLIAVGDVAEQSLFGASVSTSRDTTGAWLAVGAPFSAHRGAQTGAVYRWHIER